MRTLLSWIALGAATTTLLAGCGSGYDDDFRDGGGDELISFVGTTGVFAAWADASLRGEWLDAPELSFTKLNAGRNIRARWPDGARLDIRFNATGPDRCQIVVDTMKLDDGEAVQRAKAFWQAQFERLERYFNV